MYVNIIYGTCTDSTHAAHIPPAQVYMYAACVLHIQCVCVCVLFPILHVRSTHARFLRKCAQRDRVIALFVSMHVCMCFFVCGHKNYHFERRPA